MAGVVIPDKRKLVDGDGLYLHLRPSKSGFGMHWKHDYSFAGKRKTYSYGKYPIITLTKARELHKETRVTLARGDDPSQLKQQNKTQATIFKHLALEWYQSPQNTERWSETYYKKVGRIFERDVFPVFGDIDIKHIKPSDVVKVVKAIDQRGAPTQASIMLQITQSVFKYAMTLGKADNNPAAIDLKMLIAPRIKKPLATLTDPKAIGLLLNNIDLYEGYIQTRIALQLAPMLMLRPTELRSARWNEIDFNEKTYTIPANRMKSRQHIKTANLEQDAHIVPLPHQAVTLLQQLHDHTGVYRFVFPSPKSPNHSYLSTHTLSAALRIMGYTPEQMTIHGFRAMASTLLNGARLEDGSPRFNPDAIERQLAHTDRNKIRRAYNRADYLPERREMLQWWADYLDGLRAYTPLPLLS